MLVQQLPLSISLRDDATFDNFFVADDCGNRQVLEALQHQINNSEHSILFCWGASGSGVTHLLQAACHAAAAGDLTCQYLPLSDLLDYPPHELLEQMEDFELLCLDDVHSVIGRELWEQALFNLINRVRDRGSRLLMGADRTPMSLVNVREDLRSRFAWGAIFQLHSLDDAGKKAALQFRAKARGMELTDDVARYILNRVPRDTKKLFFLLDQLDRQSLVSKRKLTIPFVTQVVKQILGDESPVAGRQSPEKD